MIKKIGALFIAGLLVSTLLAGCGQTAGQVESEIASGAREVVSAAGDEIEGLKEKLQQDLKNIESKLEGAKEEAEKITEEEKEKLEAEAKELEKKLGDAMNEAGVTKVVEEVKADAAKIEENIEVKGKAALEALKEDATTLKYKFTQVEAAAALELSEIQAKVEKLGDEIGARLQTLKDKGVADAQILVQFVDKEGKELYSKLFQ